MKQQLIARCKELGCGLLDCGDTIRVDAPVGKVVANTQVHYADLYLRGWKRNDAYRELLTELSGGLADCPDGNCEVCEEAMSFDELYQLYRGERLA